MKQPKVCPRPGPHNPGPDCPLWDARQRIQFQRGIEADTAAHPTLGAAVWADFNRSYQRPSIPPTRPVPASSRSLVLPDAPSTSPVFASAKAPTQKGTNHA